MKPRTGPLIAVLAGAGALMLASPAHPQQGPRTHIVIMDNMVFGRMPADAKVGDVIIWDNQDTVQHTATARDGSFDLRLQPGKKGRTVLRKAGNQAIWCIYHPMMRTTLRVAAS